jgi:hypothetical protein
LKNDDETDSISQQKIKPAAAANSRVAESALHDGGRRGWKAASLEVAVREGEWKTVPENLRSLLQCRK